MDSGEDQQLVSRCVSGEVEAFAPLVARYQKVLFNVALRMIGNRQDAEDITQTAFLRAFEKLRTYDPSYRFFSWIYRIAVNECLNVLGRRRPEGALDPSLPAKPSGQDPVEEREVREHVEEAVLKLPPDLKQVVILRHFVELSYREMSAALAIPEKTVKSRLYSARQRLGEMLTEGRGVR
jgi:RNA polymerase sigma-70 factor (ECF subfamily)